MLRVLITVARESVESAVRFSTRSVFTPYRARVIPVTSPAGPPPTMRTSGSFTTCVPRANQRCSTPSEPLKAGGLADAVRIEMPGGDLHQAGLNGALLDLDEARAAVAAEPPALPGTMR